MTAIIIQARMGSIRLPGKIMKNLAGHPMLWHVVDRCRKSKKANQVIIATTTNSEDSLVEKWCQENKIFYHRGSPENVLERYYETAKKFRGEVVVRITGDCALVDPKIIDICIDVFNQKKCDYLSNFVQGKRTFPMGLETEVFSFSALKKAYQQATENYEKEHVTPYIWENKKKEFVVSPAIRASSEYARSYRLTVDYPQDFELMEKIYKKFYRPGGLVNVPEVLSFLDKNPDWIEINAGCEQRLYK